MKTITKKQFRFLLTLFIALEVVGTVTGIFDPWLLPKPLLDYQHSQHGVRPQVGDVIIGLLGIPGVVAGIISIIGLYRFWPCARWLAVVAWIYMLVWMPFSTGPVLSSALTGAFTFCAALLAGAVLAIVYFSPAADWFQKKELTHDA
jgi:hypothetical protein